MAIKLCVECDVGVSLCVRENVYVTFMMQMTENKLGARLMGMRSASSFME